MILAEAEAVVTLLFFVLNHCVASYEYLLGEYTVPVTDVIFTFSSLLLSVGCTVCLALCIKSPKAEQENIVDNSEKDDIIVLAGKGHETYQEIMGVKYHMDEREIVAEYLRK